MRDAAKLTPFTQLKKLKAATLMLATLQAPEGDIADLGDLDVDGVGLLLLTSGA